MEITSPITGTYNTKIISSIPSSVLIDGYRNNSAIDVSKFFVGVDKVHRVRCLETGYEFAYPKVLGDGDFYDQLEKKSGDSYYYKELKWEHLLTEEHIKNSDRVLEIGFGKGSFLEHLHGKGINCFGIDINDAEVENLKAKGLQVACEPLEKHVDKGNKYDVIITYHVIEHVYEVEEFFNNCKGLLNKGGKLIFAVPNNDSFLQYDQDNILNNPPHHCGFWKTSSIPGVAKYFGFKVDVVQNSTLLPENVFWYTKILLKRYGLALSYDNFLFRTVAKFVHKFRKKLKGDALFTVLTKEND